MNDICNRLSDILHHESKEIVYSVKGESIHADLDCFAMTGYTAAALWDLAKETGKPCVITIQSIENPRLQIIFG